MESWRFDVGELWRNSEEGRACRSSPNRQRLIERWRHAIFFASTRTRWKEIPSIASLKKVVPHALKNEVMHVSINVSCWLPLIFESASRIRG